MDFDNSFLYTFVQEHLFLRTFVSGRTGKDQKALILEGGYYWVNEGVLELRGDGK